jgi:hypothetical protein
MKQAGMSIDLHPLQTTTRRSAFEYVTAQIEFRQLLNAVFGPALHPIRMIGPCSRRNEANSPVTDNEPKRLTRNAQSHFELGTNRHPLDMTAEHVGKKRITLLPSVKTDPFAQQAGDTDPYTPEFLLFALRKRIHGTARIEGFKRSVVQAVPSCS